MRDGDYEIIENDTIKCLRSKDVNYTFNKVNGNSFVWGRTTEEDPDWSPYGPFIADIEITTKCKGPGGKLCKFCYKSNTTSGYNMSLETFQTVFDKFPPTLQQIAFGVDAQCESNPDTFKIMQYCRDNGVIPNVTVADITDETATELSRLCGAVAVSRYDDKDICYDSVKKLTDKGMEQVNIHMMISEETYDQALLTICDIDEDPRLKDLNAIVFLSLKKKGRGYGYNQLSDSRFRTLTQLCLKLGVSFGFDSCSALKFLKSVEGHPDYDKFVKVSEPCESARFSAYVNVDGCYVPCSFCEDVLCHMDGTESWGKGINVAECDDFMKDIWYNRHNKMFRDKSLVCLENNVACQVFDI